MFCLILVPANLRISFNKREDNGKYMEESIAFVAKNT
jgi:hypothetical protein